MSLAKCSTISTVHMHYQVWRPGNREKLTKVLERHWCEFQSILKLPAHPHEFNLYLYSLLELYLPSQTSRPPPDSGTQNYIDSLSSSRDYVLICNKSFISLLVVLWQISFSKHINNICHLRVNSRNLLLDSMSPFSWNWKSLWLLQLMAQLIQEVSLGCKWLLKLLRLGHRKRELLLTLLGMVTWKSSYYVVRKPRPHTGRPIREERDPIP